MRGNQGSLYTRRRQSRPGLAAGQAPVLTLLKVEIGRVPAPMRIADLLARSRPSISFEFMAPRDESEVDVLERTVAALAGHAPDWVSVTYRVRTGEKTLELVTRIKRHYHIEAMAHLTCATTADRTRQILNWMGREGAANARALRGEPSLSGEAS